MSQLLQSLRDETQRSEALREALASSNDRWAELGRVLAGRGPVELKRFFLKNDRGRVRELGERKSDVEKSTQTEAEVKDEPSKEDEVLRQQQPETGETPPRVRQVRRGDSQSHLCRRFQAQSEVDAMKAQMKTLFKELQQAQSKLDDAEGMKKNLQDR